MANIRKKWFWTLIEECVFGVGDGVGGTEKNLGLAGTSAECIEMVRTQQPSANGVTYGTTSGGFAKMCYAEFGATSANNDTDWQTCLLDGTNSYSWKFCKKLAYKIKITYSSIFIEYQIYVTEESTAVVSATAKATGLNATTSGTYYFLCT